MGLNLHFRGILCYNFSDCRPSDELAKIGRNSDLLIHEATFDDSESAIIKKHSTITEAIAVGKK
jgi:ribonuclease Z